MSGAIARAGYEWDAETGLYLLAWRWYDPYPGRFVTRDPISYAGGLNLYAYCGGDPLGLAPCCGSSSRLGRWLRGAWENLRDLASVRRWMPHVAWGEIGWDMGAGANAGLFGLFGGGDAAREQIGPEAFKVSKRASGVAMVSGGAAVMGYVTAEREVVKAMMGRPTAAAEALRARTEPIRAEVFRWGMNAEFAPQKRAALVKIGPHVHMWPNTKAHLYPGRYAQVRGWIEPLRNDLRAAAKKYPDIAVQRGQVHLP